MDLTGSGTRGLVYQAVQGIAPETCMLAEESLLSGFDVRPIATEWGSAPRPTT